MDISSLNIASAGVSLTLAVALLAIRANRRTYAGFDLWVAGNACSAAALLLIANLGAIPTALVVLGNTLVFLHLVLITAGLERFFGLAPRWSLHGLGIAAIVGVYVQFTAITPSVTVRIAAICTLLAMWSWWAALLVAREAPRVLDRPNRLAAGVLGLYSLWNIGRVVVALSGSDATNALDANRRVQAMFFAAYPALLALLTFSLAILYLQRVERDLAAAAAEVKLLRGIIPICASCKKIREGDGWTPIESYLAQRSEAAFTHGICPDCARRLYPGLIG